MSAPTRPRCVGTGTLTTKPSEPTCVPTGMPPCGYEGLRRETLGCRYRVRIVRGLETGQRLWVATTPYESASTPYERFRVAASSGPRDPRSEEHPMTYRNPLRPRTPSRGSSWSPE